MFQNALLSRCSNFVKWETAYLTRVLIIVRRQIQRETPNFQIFLIYFIFAHFSLTKINLTQISSNPKFLFQMYF